jgi:ADP-ribose pyrophosphatase
VSLPAPPPIVLQQTGEDPQPAARGGFLELRRVELVAHYPDGTTSTPFSYDMVQRRALDAAIIVAHFVGEGGRNVILRSCVRPAVAARPRAPKHDALLWELPAGLIEPGEDPRAAAARELYEEIGAKLAPSDMKDLGPWMFPVPAMIAEVHAYFHAEIDPKTLHVPPGDASPLEYGAELVTLPLRDALAHCAAGRIRDLKTELGLRRLRDLVGE